MFENENLENDLEKFITKFDKLYSDFTYNYSNVEIIVQDKNEQNYSFANNDHINDNG